MGTFHQIYRVPPHLTAFTCRHVTRFCKSLLESTADQVIVDASSLDYADPFGLCLTAATLQELRRNCDVVVRDVPESQWAYLERMDFFTNAGIKLEGTKPTATSRRRHDIVELRQIGAPREVDVVARSLAEAMVGRISSMPAVDDPDPMTGYTERDRLTRPLQYLFSELLENSVTHGKKHSRKSARAWVACQYDPGRDKIRLAIVDNGCGLRRSLAGHPAVKEDSDLASIEAAVQPRVSSNRELGIRIIGHESVNQGIGLTICRDIAINSKGILHMLTGISHAMFQSQTIGRARDVHKWMGTAVAVELDRAALRSLRMEVLFQPYQKEPSAQVRFE